MKNSISIFWFRRDLRLSDNKALHYALKGANPVLPIFIFDDNILNELDKDDSRVEFIYTQLVKLKMELQSIGSDIVVKIGNPIRIIKEIINDYNVKSVFCNKDHEPYGIDRDKDIQELLAKSGIEFIQYLDHLIADKNSVLKSDGKPYTVYTPFKNRFKQVISSSDYIDYDVNSCKNNFAQVLESFIIPSMHLFGFKSKNIEFPSANINPDIIKNYNNTRDIPSIEGTTKLGIHIRFGTISIRELYRNSIDLNEVFINELIWREFYAMILMHYPNVVYSSFKKQYDNIKWINDDKDFESWMNGETGYEIVDAGMRQLNETGCMHNRVRMITASFLTKHLLIDWRWGEAYFARKLLDYELSSNNGGWQWCAGSGSDAAPYFRIFNPERQMEKFDPKKEYIRMWIPEFDSNSYRNKIVDHKRAIERCKIVYSSALK
ncbi:MAG: deoxyribodipyrimidine photo-lyase [Bacteroidetes bacterium]|nr:deoxyribodipyrimidine photo-lyase [Bacteroidota bacterium]